MPRGLAVVADVVELQRIAAESIPVGRVGQPEDVAHSVSFFAGAGAGSTPGRSSTSAAPRMGEAAARYPRCATDLVASRMLRRPGSEPKMSSCPTALRTTGELATTTGTGAGSSPRCRRTPRGSPRPPRRESSRRSACPSVSSSTCCMSSTSPASRSRRAGAGGGGRRLTHDGGAPSGGVSRSSPTGQRTPSVASTSARRFDAAQADQPTDLRRRRRSLRHPVTPPPRSPGVRGTPPWRAGPSARPATRSPAASSRRLRAPCAATPAAPPRRLGPPRR